MNPGPERSGHRSADDGAQATPATGALATEVWAEIRAFAGGEDRHRALRTALDLGPGKAGVLLGLEQGPMTLREIAQTADVDPPAATVAVDNLQRRGFVRRTAHPDDNRRKLVHLTDAGVQAAQTARRILTGPPPTLARLDEDDLNALLRIFSVLNTPE
jgi:DNA-binding MarR family transcriptional regulator